MKPIFGDTVYFLALVNRADSMHDQAMAFSRQSPGPLVTTEWVLTEVADALCQSSNRTRFTRLRQLLQGQEDVEIVPASSDLFHRGCQLYSERVDKNWSLTDCISFIVMTDRDMTRALTSDHHIGQAGFEALLHVQR